MSDGEDMATPKTLDDDYPLELLRFFKEKEHAEQFLAGVIRLGSLCYYKSAEQERDADPARHDPSEGRGLITAAVENVVTVKTNTDFDRIDKISEAPGDVSYYLNYVGPLYILSCTDPQKADIDELKKENLGKYVVQITDPRQLAQQLIDRFSKLDSTDPFAAGQFKFTESGMTRTNTRIQNRRPLSS